MLGSYEYQRVQTIEEGCQALAESDGAAVVLAGGTDLLVEIRNGLRSPALLVDCKRVAELSKLSVDSNEATIGASVTLNHLIENRQFRSAYPALTDALFSIGTYQLRNRATLAGNLCNASPAADSAPILLVLDAQVDIAGTNGPRTVPLAEFFTGVKKTVLRPGEIVAAIRIPARNALSTAFLKQQRIRGHDLAVANMAAAFDPKGKALRVAVGSCAPTPLLLDAIPVDLSNHQVFAGHVAEYVLESVSPISDVRASADYRKAILPILARRIVHKLLGQGGEA